MLQYLTNLQKHFVNISNRQASCDGRWSKSAGVTNILARIEIAISELCQYSTSTDVTPYFSLSKLHHFKQAGNLTKALGKGYNLLETNHD